MKFVAESLVVEARRSAPFLVHGRRRAPERTARPVPLREVHRGPPPKFTAFSVVSSASSLSYMPSELSHDRPRPEVLGAVDVQSKRDTACPARAASDSRLKDPRTARWWVPGVVSAPPVVDGGGLCTTGVVKPPPVVDGGRAGVCCGCCANEGAASPRTNAAAVDETNRVSLHVVKAPPDRAALRNAELEPRQSVKVQLCKPLAGPLLRSGPIAPNLGLR
jgi:hypothetical protein